MKTLEKFEYIIPNKVKEVVSLLEQYGNDAKIIAGGTDLVGLMKDRVVTPRCLINIKNIKELDFIEYDEEQGLRMGSLTTISQLNQSEIIKEKFPAIYDATEAFATTQIRNMATVGGNIGRSAPSADMVPVLIALGAQITLVGKEQESDGCSTAAKVQVCEISSNSVRGVRVVALDQFFTGPGKNILNNEIITEIRIPAEKRPYGAAFEKVGRTAEDLAKANCAVKVVFKDGKCEDARVAFGAVGPTPLRGRKVEEALIGKVLTDSAIEEAAAKTREDISPITDVRSNVEYRNHICTVMVKRLIKKAISGR